MKSHPSSRGPSGVALVSTMIILAVLAVVAVAFMQSATTDRASSRSGTTYYKAQLAAEAGLAEAMAQMAQAMTNFNYVSGAEPVGSSYRTYVRPTRVVSGVWQSVGTNVYLDSGTNAPLTNLVVAGPNTNTGVVVRAQVKTLSATNSQTNTYAFWVDEAGGKQNLTWWGGGTNRGLVTNVADLPLVLPSANGTTVSALSAGASNALASARSYSVVTTNLFGTNTAILTASNALLTPATFNLLDSSISNASSYFFTLFSPSSAATPLGGRKLNLQNLARYITNGMSAAQGSNSPRATLVDQLLLSNPPNATNWGGGDLSWLATSGNYTTNEQRQIVANLIDYLDDDLIPTTDSDTAPTFFGLEMRADSSGRVQGHPFINFISVGLIFNRSTGNELNSTRVLCSLGLAYPWSSTSTAAAAYTPEIEIAVKGTVANPIMALGTNAQAYFGTNFTDEINSRPVSTFTPFTGNNWPQAVGLAGTASYATPFTGFSTGAWPTRGPTNITFQNLTYTISKIRLLFTPTSGAPGYVQIIPTNLVITNQPSNVVAAGGGGSLAVKFTESAFAQTANLYLATDPRAHFRPTAWTNLASLTSYGTNIPAPSGGAGQVVMSNGVSTNWDTAQSMPMNFNWYISTNVSNHLNRSTNTNGAISIGELGYLWTGRPWQTLSMTATNLTPVPDWNLLDYVTSGFLTNTTINITAMPLRLPTATGTNVTASNSLVQEGGFNILTRKLATATAFLTNAPGLAANAPATFIALPLSTNLASAGGALATLTNLSAATATKFAREAVIRAAGNAAVTQSRVFTVYSRGEYSSGTTRSSVLLEADVFVDVNEQTGTPRLRVLSKNFR
ncbi:MAG: PilX N-terminal domain-containing pilus assembly protein [Chthoniobacterales bacterium]